MNARKRTSRESLQYCSEIKKKCTEQWERICEIEAKPNKTQALEEELSTLKHCFTLAKHRLSNAETTPLLG